ncbi:hypothetical protein ABZ547_26560 [Streptomyces sparsogenes]|uniref:hypothetical protein n=1 Tax=Streptomyces sparsogenes TaxID=67365 RepID=UPI0033ED08B2
MNENGEHELTVYYQHLAELLKRSDDENFQALLAQARHITGRSYETTLYDHQQTFRLLWHHLERTGHLRCAHREIRARLDSGQATPAEVAELELFLSVYAGVRAGAPDSTS